MVLENLQTTTVAEWLLGGKWYEGQLWQPPIIATVIALLVVSVALVVRRLRGGENLIAPQTALRFGTFICIATFLAAIPLSVLMTRLTTPDEKVQKALDHVLEPLGKNLDRFFGTGWMDGALCMWLFITWGTFTVIYGITWIVRTAAIGPAGATTECGRGLLDILRDLARTSPRRVLALAWLAWRESLRRRVWVVFVVFMVLIMFAGWFMHVESPHPAQLYLQFVLNWTMYFSLIFSLVLSSLSLPADIQDRTLHTIVTKPVRTSEILLGRLLGFTAMGTFLLVLIGVMGYAFTEISLRHTHHLDAASLHAEAVPGQINPLLRGLTSKVHGHQHEVTIAPSGEALVATQFDHTHLLFSKQENGKTVYWLGPPKGFFAARVPIYARSLGFEPPDPKSGKGVNVGDEWMYRSFIAGGTPSSAIWTFQINPSEFSESKYPTGIPLEITIEPFRTHKGDQEKGVLGVLWVRNPKNKEMRATVANFQAKKWATDTQYIPFALQKRAAAGHGAVKIDFFKDIVDDDGKFEVGLQCLEHGQYFGMARADLYIRAADASFALNFVKGYVGIWMQMVMILSIGLFWSTFVSGPVSMLCTLCAMLFGWFRPFVFGLAVATVVGGGPVESAIRMGLQENQINPLPPGIATSAAVEIDKAARVLLRAIQAVLPPVTDFDYVKHVAFGFDINATMLAKSLCSELAYVVPVLVLAYFCLRAREIAQ